MLNLAETRWHFKALKLFSNWNLLPAEIDVKTGKIQKQSKKMRIFLWRTQFCLGIFHCFYMIWRLVQSTLIGISHCFYMLLTLVQSTILEPEKYFRWDHFILHFPFALGCPLLYFTGFCLFGKNREESVLIFNQLFEERENPVQKMVEEEEEEEKAKQEQQRKSGSGRAKKDFPRPKSQFWIQVGSKLTAVSAPDQNKIQHKVPSRDSNSDSETQQKSKSKAKSESSCLVRPLLTWPPQYSLDELLAKTFAVLMEATKIFCVVIFVFGPNRPQLLFSSLPPEYQNIYSFLALLAVEIFFMTVSFSIATFSIVSQLLFFGKCQLEFKRLDLQLRNLKETFQNRPLENREMRREIWILHQISKEMREFVLFVELFNRVFPPCIFAFKLIGFFSIPLYFFTIRHGQDFPFLALFTAYGSVAATLIYGILYEKAFSIPEKMERLKREFLLAAHKTTKASVSKPTQMPPSFNTNFWPEMNREIGGIRDVGVKVGSFHTLERETTPRFVDFVVKNVVNLLVTFPR